MIGPEGLALFVAASVALTATPGPNVALIVGTSLKHGRRAGVLTAMGANAGLMLQLAVVTAGLSYVVEAFARNFDLLRYLGAAYLAVLAVRQWRAADRAGGVGDGEGKGSERRGLVPSGRAVFVRGLAVALANPKTLLFYAAFLPQFVTRPESPLPEILLLAAIFSAIALSGDTLWALAADRARAVLSRHFTRLADRISAGILLGGAVVLLAMGRR